MPKNTNGVTPRLVVVIGEKAYKAISYSGVQNNRAEPDTCTVELSMDEIDSSIFAQKGRYWGVKVYAGYIDERIDRTTLVKDLIEGKKYKDKLFKRFEGFVNQTEWSIGDKVTVTINCKDAAGLLQDIKFSDKKEGAAANAKAIIAEMNKHIKGVNVKLNATDFAMGTKDSKGQKQTYSISGKTYWDVIKDIAAQGSLNISTNGFSIVIGPQEKWKKHYQMVRTSSKDVKRDWSTFTNMTVRQGEAGKRAKENLIVLIHGVSDAKERGTTGKPSPKAILGKFPKTAKNYTGDENTEIIKLYWKQPLSQQKADQVAEMVAYEYLRGFTTGDVDIPFADPRMEVDDAISFKGDKNFGLDFLDGKKFRIEEIDESFNSEQGYQQKLKFESNPRFEKEKAQERIAPTQKEGRILVNPGYTTKQPNPLS